jgi:four helix bundle protein
MNARKEDFERRIYKYVLALIGFLGRLPKDNIVREIIGQLMRSGTSVGANYFEAKSASSRKDFINYFNHSLKSANESKFWLNVLREGKLVRDNLQGDCDDLLKETVELSRIFASSILTMKRTS